MAKINSRNKGSKGERVASKVLEEWTGKKFARVPSSGGLSWHTSNSTGDIICATEGHYFPFSVEVKLRDQINFDHLLYLDKAKILDFWEQSKRDALRVNKCPIVMMRYDRLPKDFFFIILPLNIFAEFFDEYTNGKTDKIVTYNNQFVIMTTELLKKIPYKKIRKPLRKYMKDGKG